MMNSSLKKHFAFLICIIAAHLSTAQNTNFDFSMLNFTNWNRTVGVRGNCCSTPVNSGVSHFIVSTPGNDGVIGSALPRIPSGKTQVVRLGHPSGGNNGGTGLGWRLDHTINVTQDNSILHYEVAVVGDGTHGCLGSAQNLPLNGIFEARVTDASGTPLTGNTCAEYTIQSCSQGAMQMTSSFNTSYYFPWASVGLDLSAYIGQTVNVEFTVYTCYYLGVHGNTYAYIAPNLLPKNDTVYFCKNASSLTIEGLPRFAGYNWGTMGNTQNITVNNPVDGATYSCTYTSFNGCSMTQNVVLKEGPPKAAFSYVPGVCNQLLFTDSSYSPTSNVTSWQWSFGDPATAPNDTSDIQNPDYTYSDTGYYNVTLMVQDSLGCRDTITQQVHVTLGGSGNFTFNNPCENSPVQFTSTSSATVSHRWDFGNGDTSSNINPVYTYATPGTYTVTLITENSFGCTDTIVQQLTVNPSPLASFVIPPLICEQEDITINNTSLNAASYTWDFGDGNTSPDINPVHTYSTAGTYTITLIAQNSFGCTDTIVQQLTVSPSPVASFTIPPLVCEQEHIAINNTSLSAASYTWDFGDGDTSSNINPVHTYNTAGTYTVTLITGNSSGCTNTLQQTIQVHPQPVAAFEANPVLTTASAPQITFTNQSTGETSWQWNFGDGQQSTIENPVYSYESEGEYTVVLVVSNDEQCTDTTEVTVTILEEMVIPNVFTPNGDGFNDIFSINYDPDVISSIEMVVFDRLGGEVFRTDNPLKGWDGTTNNQPVADGVYYYIVTTTKQEQTKEYKGFITLLR